MSNPHQFPSSCLWRAAEVMQVARIALLGGIERSAATVPLVPLPSFVQVPPGGLVLGSGGLVWWIYPQ